MALPPKTKGELGIVRNSRTIQSESAVRLAPEINFSWTPLASATTFEGIGLVPVGEVFVAQDNTYPYAANEPRTGAPDQPDVRGTTAFTAITFTASVRIPEGLFITEYEWDFGDGFKGFGPITTHTYNTGSPSTRTVLCVTDNLGRRFCRGRYMNLRPAQITTATMGISGSIASTSPATDIGTTTAILRGSIDGDPDGTYYFQYGTTTGYGTSTTPQPIGTFAGPRSVSQSIGGLLSATTYNFRLVADYGAGGTSFGANRTFITS
jgi:hypothetical protein